MQNSAKNEKGRCVAIIQARMGSTRLPEKVLMTLGPKPVLGWVIDRTCKAKRIDQCVVATTELPEDDVIVDYCHSKNIACWRGSSSDVLSRYNDAAAAFSADTVVRITSDCPFIDPEIIDKVIGHYQDNFPKLDYVSNSLERTYPRGLDVEVFSQKALAIADIEALELSEREHVTLFIYKRPSRFHLANIRSEKNLSSYRLTLDTPEDLLLLRLVAEAFAFNPFFSYKELTAVMEQHPNWQKINNHIGQKPL